MAKMAVVVLIAEADGSLGAGLDGRLFSRVVGLPAAVAAGVLHEVFRS